MSKKVLFLFLITFFILLVSILIIFYIAYTPDDRGLISCPADAKACPDGSYVGRTGPNCDFRACPLSTKDWILIDKKEYGFEMKYPEDFFDNNHQPLIFFGDCDYQGFPNVCPDISNIVKDDILINSYYY